MPKKSSKKSSEISKNEVWVLDCVYDGSSDDWLSVHFTLQSAQIQMLVEILAWVGGNWKQYSKESVKLLKKAVKENNYDEVLNVWNGMSSMEMYIDRYPLVNLNPQDKPIFR